MNTNDPDGFEDEIERLKQENQLKRMKLRLEYGANFPIESSNEDLSPQEEGKFLDYIAQFEKAYRNSDRITVYEYIGKPAFRKTETIADDEISAELITIFQILIKNQIELNTLCEVDDRTLYQFITEELFQNEIDNIRISGMLNHFIYEEFHPNHEFDITNNATYFLRSFLEKESDFYRSYLSPKAKKNHWFENFRNAFNSFDLNEFEIINIEFDEKSAIVIFHADFSGIIEGSAETEVFVGSGRMDLIYEDDYWCIHKIDLPKT